MYSEIVFEGPWPVVGLLVIYYKFISLAITVLIRHITYLWTSEYTIKIKNAFCKGTKMKRILHIGHIYRSVYMFYDILMAKYNIFFFKIHRHSSKGLLHSVLSKVTTQWMSQLHFMTVWNDIVVFTNTWIPKLG